MRARLRLAALRTLQGRPHFVRRLPHLLVDDLRAGRVSYKFTEPEVDLRAEMEG